ncbi:MAG TPA: hypothetical protein VGG48_19020 [Rhizomicrobium sp.]|jgi:hypothetical protein
MRYAASFLAAVLFVSVGVAAASPADGFVPTGEPQTFSFDTRDGFFESDSRTLDCSVNAIRGTVHFARFGRPTTEWKPFVSVALRHGQGDAETYVALMALAAKFQPPFATKLAIGHRDDNPGSGIHFAATTGAGGTFDFFLRWTQDGVVTGVIDGQPITMPLNGAPENLEFSGSTGAGEILYSLGNVSDPGNSCHPIASRAAPGIGDCILDVPGKSA